MHINRNHDVTDTSINLIDLLRFLASHWMWYVLSIILFTGFFMYNYAKAPLMYNRTATIMIRNTDNTPETIRLRRSAGMSSRTDGALEIQQLRTKELMRSAIERMNADVSYTVLDGLRTKELYLESPVLVSFLDASPQSTYSFVLTPKDREHVVVHDFFEMSGPILVNLQDTITTPAGRLIITPTDNYKQTWMGRSIKVTKFDIETMVNYFQGSLRVIQPQSSVPILQISLNDRSGVRAADMLYTLINVFNENNIEEKNRVSVNTGKFILDRLSIIEQDLGEVENDLELLKEKNEGLDINTVAGLYLGETREFKNANKELDSRLQMVGYMKHYLENEPHLNALIPNSTGLGSVDIEKQIVQYNNALLKRKRLAEGNNKNNPVVQEIDKSLSLMRVNLLTAIESLYSSLEMIKARNTKEEILAREKIRGIPVKQREVLSVERQQKVKEELYIYLLNKREENALNGAMTDSNARIIDSPTGSRAPVSPVKLNKMAMGVGLGLLFPTLVLLLLFKFDTRVKSRKDIERMVSIPFLGSLPFCKKTKLHDQILVKADGWDALSESFRILRANLDFLITPSKHNKVITCISFNPGAGKTFVSLNLAACLSLTKKRVIVLDMDLRKVTLSNLTQTNKLKGISHYLADESLKVDEIIQHNVLGAGIDLIPAGAIAPNPSELLMGERLDELIEKLKEMYDYVLIDNVPIGIVADSAIVDRVVDISLFIVRAGKLDRNQLVELDQLYKERQLRNMAIVLNGSKIKPSYSYKLDK